MLEIYSQLRALWQAAALDDKRYFNWEYIYQLIQTGYFKTHQDAPLTDSWVVAACQKNIPIYTPGFDDSTLGNMFCADVIRGRVASHNLIRSGIEMNC